MEIQNYSLTNYKQTKLWSYSYILLLSVDHINGLVLAAVCNHGSSCPHQKWRHNHNSPHRWWFRPKISTMKCSSWEKGPVLSVLLRLSSSSAQCSCPSGIAIIRDGVDEILLVAVMSPCSYISWASCLWTSPSQTSYSTEVTEAQTSSSWSLICPQFLHERNPSCLMTQLSLLLWCSACSRPLMWSTIWRRI